jgi:hypothetical protein
MEEDILQAHVRIHHKLIFMISCYDPEYALKYVQNLNNKTFKNFFKIFKLDTPEEINDIYEKLSEKKVIFVTKLPTPELYSFNFIKDVYHIHLAIHIDKEHYLKYTSDIKNVPIQKFINVKNNSKMYDNYIEDRLFQYIIELIDRKVNGRPFEKKSEGFRRMTQDGNKVILYGKRNLIL